jgi:hypothetical protein
MKYRHLGPAEIVSGVHSNYLEIYARWGKRGGWRIRAVNDDGNSLGVFRGSTLDEAIKELTDVVIGLNPDTVLGLFEDELLQESGARPGGGTPDDRIPPAVELSN